MLIKFRQAQFLAGEYGRQTADRLEPTEAEVDAYIGEHPELDPKNARARAAAIAQRLRSGESFEKLAKIYSNDPGSSEKGGLYVNVKKGQFVPQFEAAALALEPGQISEPIETALGFHIIKLINKTADAFTVRHILIGTTPPPAPDAKNPFANAKTLREQARDILQKEKVQKFTEEIAEKYRGQITIAE